MYRTLSFLTLPLLAQSLCSYPQDLGYVVWGIYHPLERGRGELMAYSIARALLADSTLREVAYIHNVRYEVQRMGTWLLIQGTSTADGLYAFLTALRGSIDRFPQRLQQGIPPEMAPHPLSTFFRQVYEDTFAVDWQPVAVSRAFYEYWREGKLRIVLRGRISAPLVRACRMLFSGVEVPFTYVPPELVKTPAPLPRQGVAVIYVRWRLPQAEGLSDWIALWAHSQALMRFLCEDRQLTCQATWVPIPDGLEAWIETSLPVATEEAVRDFLSRPYRPPARSVGAFMGWMQAPDNLFLSAWWACVWGLPALPKEVPTISPRHLHRAMRRCTTVAFAIGG